MQADEPILVLPPVSAAGGPLYQQIIDALKREVSEGRLTPGSPLPSFRALAEQLLVSVITVKRAYDELERDGIIFRRQGLGTFVAEQGEVRSREVKSRTAADHFAKGIREAAEAGLSRREIQKLFEKALADQKG